MAEVAGSKVLTEDELDSSSLATAIDEILGKLVVFFLYLCAFRLASYKTTSLLSIRIEGISRSCYQTKYWYINHRLCTWCQNFIGFFF